MNGDQLLHFLLVEDNEDHALLVKRTLEMERIANSLQVFQQAEPALEYLRDPRSQHPHLILLDINLPGMNGLEALKILKSDESLKALPVVMLSTSLAESDIAKAYEYSANSYLTKPVDFNQFRQMIKDVGLYWGVWNKPLSQAS